MLFIPVLIPVGAALKKKNSSEGPDYLLHKESLRLVSHLISFSLKAYIAF